MGRFTKQVAGWLAAAALVGAAGAFAVDTKVADFENASNANLVGNYWFFFDDSKDSANFSGGTATKRAQTSVVHSAEVKGSGADKELLFTEALSIEKETASGNAAKLEFTWGETMDMGWGKAKGSTAGCDPVASGGCYKYQQYVGIGTNLVKDGVLTSPPGFAAQATAISFVAWADEEISVTIKLVQSNVQGSADFEVPFDITASPKKHTALISEFAQPSWAKDDGYDIPFDKTKIIKLQWQIQAQSSEGDYPLNPLPGAAKDVKHTFYLDDVVIEGWEYIAPDLCVSCVGTTGKTAGTLFSDFEASAVNSLGYYWYAYDDTKTVVDAGSLTGSSSFNDGVGDPDDEGQRSLVTAGNGIGTPSPSGGAMIAFTMGNTMTIRGNAVQPFVGLGSNLYDEEEKKFYDADANEVTGFYIEYMTGPTVATIDFEVQDQYDVNGTRPEDVVRYIKLPGTNGAWKSATVLFSQLLLHEEWESVTDWLDTTKVAAAKKLDTKALAKLQLKYQGGGQGYMAVDNVYLVGGTSSIRLGSKAAVKAAGMKATYSRGVVGVNWNAAKDVAGGKVSLINTKGRVVASAPIAASGSKVTAKLGAGKLPTGMYFVRVNAKDINGKKIVSQAPVSIVK